MSIRERGRELAVMRAIGFDASTILICLVSEASLVAIAGGLLGGLVIWLVLGGFAPSLPGVNFASSYEPRNHPDRNRACVDGWT